MLRAEEMHDNVGDASERQSKLDRVFVDELQKEKKRRCREVTSEGVSKGWAGQPASQPASTWEGAD